MANKSKREGKKKDVTNEIVTREYTINLHKRIHGM
jgi:large subunit ribosomal protein L31e